MCIETTRVAAEAIIARINIGLMLWHSAGLLLADFVIGDNVSARQFKIREPAYRRKRHTKIIEFCTSHISLVLNRC